MAEFKEVVHRVIGFQVVWGITGRVCVGLTSHAVLPRVGLLKERKTVALLPRATTLGLPGEEGSSRENSGNGVEGIMADSVSSAYADIKSEKATRRKSIAIVDLKVEKRVRPEQKSSGRSGGVHSFLHPPKAPLLCSASLS